MSPYVFDARPFIPEMKRVLDDRDRRSLVGLCYGHVCMTAKREVPGAASADCDVTPKGWACTCCAECRAECADRHARLKAEEEA